MSHEPRIAILDTNKERANRLGVILEFLGEKAEVIDPKQFPQKSSKIEQCASVFIGDVGKAPSLENLLSKIQKVDEFLPLVLLKQTLSLGTKKLLEHTVHDILDEPIKYPDVIRVLHRAQMAKENREREDNRPVPLFRSLVGRSEPMQCVRKLLQQVADSEATVLILGESGTGKEVAARNLHHHSSRKDKPFIAVNCGAIPHDLLESELFGHEKGAFTGAYSAKQGRFELAQGGTLFLDEIGDMPLAMQVKLLRVLQEKSFTRVGSGKEINTDVRVIAATHRDLSQLIAGEKFREDLYYRLNVFPIEMPALRDRRDDIALLITELVSRFEGEGRPGVRFLPEAIEALLTYTWPGNVRELANFVERMGIIKPGGIIGVEDLPDKFQPQKNTFKGNPIDLSKHLEKTEASLIMQVLSETGNDIDKAAGVLHMRKALLAKKILQYGLPQTNLED